MSGFAEKPATGWFAQMFGEEFSNISCVQFARHIRKNMLSKGRAEKEGTYLAAAA
jgi:hypothetical protein